MKIDEFMLDCPILNDDSNKFFSYCVYINEKPKSVKHSLSKEEIIESIKTEPNKNIKVIRTVSPLNEVVDYFNRCDNNIILFEEYTIDSIFDIDHNFVVDVTTEIFNLL